MRCALMGVAVLSLLVPGGCAPRSHAPGQCQQPDIDPTAAAAAAMAQYDLNRDGKISGSELRACPALEKVLPELDTNRSGGITAAMIASRIASWRKSAPARLPVACIVWHKRAILAGASVKFVPEKFLGPNMQTGSGTVDAQGIAVIAFPSDDPQDPPGMPPGFYRVEITQPGQNIPARYNNETVLGEEVFSRVVRMSLPTYDLDY